jgi:hypothetical protein
VRETSSNGNIFLNERSGRVARTKVEGRALSIQAQAEGEDKTQNQENGTDPELTGEL